MSQTHLDLSHLRRETRTALELAVVALAPFELLDGLAAAAGLLEALEELPRDSPAVVALVPPLLAVTVTPKVALSDSPKARVVPGVKVTIPLPYTPPYA